MDNQKRGGRGIQARKKKIIILLPSLSLYVNISQSLILFIYFLIIVFLLIMPHVFYFHFLSDNSTG